MDKYDEVYEKIKKQYYNELDNNTLIVGLIQLLMIRLYIKENMFNVSKKDSISKSNVINDMKYLETIKEIIRLVHHYYDTNLHEFR